ncbi:MAG: phosphatase PAP2 family protein [Dehalococcoidia bacterium]|nr:phosphatase PAP2 family protein [Dehalococcoidia bacterium]
MAVSTRTIAPPLATTASWLRSLGFYALEMAVFMVFFAAYFLLRGAAPTDVDKATDNALRIIELEQALGIFREAGWQQAALPHDWLIDIANMIYMHLHINLLLVVGFFFFRTDNRKFRIIKNALLLSAFIGVPFYHYIPVTPPRLLADAGHDFGFVDTLIDTRRPRPGSLANWYAAIPSYHFGWILLMTYGAWGCWSSRLVRAAFIAFAGLMWWSIVVTGNHYFLDMVLGALIVTITLALAVAFERWADRHPRWLKRLTIRAGEARIPF